MGPLAPESQDYITSLNNVEKIPVHQLTQIAPASTVRLEELHKATTKDHQLELLVRAVNEGWPQLFKDCPHSLRPFWIFRDEITYEDGILYKGAQLIMPESERQSTLKVIHMGHYAIDKMNLRAKETVYWPGIIEDIKNTYHQCQICAKFARSQQKETLQSVETSHTRWEQLGLDISLKGTQYLLTVDYFSQFPVVRKLQSLHLMSVIKILKEIFTTVGIPKCIISDVGTQFTSQEFKDFMRDWQIDHRIT